MPKYFHRYLCYPISYYKLILHEQIELLITQVKLLAQITLHVIYLYIAKRVPFSTYRL